MGRDPNEEGGRSTRKPKQKPAESGTRLFYSIYLTKAEKEEIKNGTYNFDLAVEDIEAFVGSGHSLKGKLRGDGNSFALSLVEGDKEFGLARVLSAYHADFGRAMVVLGYGLRHRYKGFPELGSTQEQEELSW
jgi:hypothetical protein